MIYYEGADEVTFLTLYIVCSVYSIWKNTVYLEGHATLQMSALPYCAGIAFFKL